MTNSWSVNRVFRSIFHYSYIALLFLAAIYLRIVWWLTSKKKRTQNYHSTFLFLPATPRNWPGGMERFGNWKSYFEKGNCRLSIHWPCSQEEFLRDFDNPENIGLFFFHFRVLIRRIRVLHSIHDYEVIYVQREVVPFYDVRNFSLEAAIIHSHHNVVFDFYDADYEATPLVTNYIFNHASKITVASKYLELLVSRHCKNVLFTRICLPVPINPKRRNGELIRIGWMGSPGNAKNLILLDKIIARIYNENNNVKFSFVCRRPPNLEFANIEWQDMNDSNFDYEYWLSGLDIGIVPYFKSDERTKAKTAMKSLEFWANRAALVCSPDGMSDKVLNETNCLVCFTNHDWYNNLSKLISDEDLREELGEKGFETFKKYHTYESNFKKIHDFLLN